MPDQKALVVEEGRRLRISPPVARKIPRGPLARGAGAGSQWRFCRLRRPRGHGLPPGQRQRLLRRQLQRSAADAAAQGVRKRRRPSRRWADHSRPAWLKSAERTLREQWSGCVRGMCFAGCLREQVVRGFLSRYSGRQSPCPLVGPRGQFSDVAESGFLDYSQGRSECQTRLRISWQG